MDLDKFEQDILNGAEFDYPKDDPDYIRFVRAVEEQRKSIMQIPYELAVIQLKRQLFMKCFIVTIIIML